MIVMSYLRFIISLVCVATVVQLLPAQTPETGKPKQFIYVLRLVPRLYSDTAWTEEEKMALIDTSLDSNTRSKRVN